MEKKKWRKKTKRKKHNRKKEEKKLTQNGREKNKPQILYTQLAIIR